MIMMKVRRAENVIEEENKEKKEGEKKLHRTMKILVCEGRKNRRGEEDTMRSRKNEEKKSIWRCKE